MGAVALIGSSVPQVSSWTRINPRSAVKAAAANTPYIKLQESRELEPVYVDGSADKISLQSASAHASVLPGQAKPLSLASGDLNSDGYPDLLCGYSTTSGGMLTLHRGDPQALAPTNRDVLRDIANNQFPDPFLKDSTVFELPDAPDFMGAGDFTRDGKMDVIVAARGGNSLYLLTGDGAGGFSSPQRIELPGTVTAMVTGEINQRDGAVDVAVGVSAPAGASVLIYEATQSLLETVPMARALPAEAKSLALGRLDDDRLNDLAIVSGTQVMVLHGKDSSGSSQPGDYERAGELETIELPFAVNAIALGEFIWDRDSRTEMAALDNNGTVHVLARGELDTRPMTAEDIQAGRQKLARLRDKTRKGSSKGLVAIETTAPAPSLTWHVAEDLPGSANDSALSAAGSAGGSSQPIMFSTRMSALPSDDLVVMNGAARQLRVMYKEAPKQGDLQLASKSIGRSSVDMETSDDVAAVLPMRLNVDGRPGLVVMSKGKDAPSFMMPMSATTYTVTRADDPAPNGCVVGDCSLREAIIDSNANPGADTIVFNAGINPTLTLTSGGSFENFAADGDLDIEDSLTITGNNQTIISTNYTSGCGDCKVFGVAQNGTPGLTVSFSGVTIQNGFNDGTNFPGSFFDTGGGVDFFLSGSGNTYSMTNCIITNNKATGSFLSHGGGVNVDSFNTASVGGPSAGTATFTGCTFSNNTADAEGGGLNLAADLHDVNVTNCTFGSNATTGASSAAGGGGIDIDHSFGGTVTISGGSVTNNTAAGVGGGINITFNPNVSISGMTVSGNTSTNGGGGSALGGGIAIVTLGVSGFIPTISLSSLTISTNHADIGAAAQGGGVYFNSFHNASLSNCSVSNNTSKSGAGIANGGSGATPEATFAISGGSVTGNAASVSGGGVASIAANTTLSKVTITGNSAATSGGGFFVSGGTLTASFCRIVGNTAPTGRGLRRTAGTASVQNNWWGANILPGTIISGTATFSPFLKLTHTASPNPILRNCPTTLTASFLVKSDGNTTSASNLDVLIGLPITFNNAVLGTISSPQATIQSSGTATATFNAGATGGNGSADATVDAVTVTAPITINAPPTITCPANITKNTDPGLCTAVATFAPTVTGFPAPTVVCSPASGSTFPKGTTPVTCTASNGIHPDATCGSPGTAPDPSCTFNVIVVDNQPPSVTCPANITVNTDAGQCSAAVNYTTPSGSDNCPGVTVVCSPASGSTFAKGTTTVTCTATDASSLTASCNFTVTVNDNQPPTIGACPSPITTNTDAGLCSAIVTYTTPTASDNCPGVAVACSPASGTAFPKGTTLVTCTATDAQNLTASCSFNVTVIDNQPPSITCPASITTNTDAGQCSAVVNYATPTGSDNCPGVTVVCSPASGAAFPKGTTTVNCLATDAASLTASCSFTVTVNDNQPPTIGACPSPITTSTDAGLCSAVVTYSTPSANDNCPGVTVVCNPASGSAFPKGMSTVTCTATDASSLTAPCSFTVTVSDNQPPAIGPCPAPITTNTDSGLCSAIVSYATPSSTDNCPGQTVACSPPSGTAFPKGTTTVTCTATDTSANTASCNFTVTVTDNQPPSITCPGNISAIESPPGSGCAVVTYTTPTPTDNCPGATANCTPASGYCFPIGSTTVTCTATDTSANTAQCTFQVNVASACTISCPANIVRGNDPGYCGAVVTFSPTTSAGCGTVNCSPSSGSFFPVGTTNVNCTTSAGPSCSFTIQVNDVESPVITCPANVSVPGNIQGSCSANVNPGTPMASDNCSVSVVGVRSDGQPLNAPYPQGTTTITWTATDPAGHQASCMQTVQVTNPDPVVTITGPPSGSLYPIGTSVNFTGTFSDTGGTHAASWSFSSNVNNYSQAGTVNESTGAITASFTFNNAGVYLVTLTVTDGCGGTGTADTVDGLTALVVIYNPNGGFITGGGWIDSPAGAYTPNPLLTGKASFGFVSKYKPGKATPDGNTEFQFRSASFNFKSTDYEFMVISGAKATLKGTGTVNGQGNYDFTLQAIDGQVNGGGGQDKFRIRIKNGNQVIYDNEISNGENDDPTTLLGGGSIVIHKND